MQCFERTALREHTRDKKSVIQTWSLSCGNLSWCHRGRCRDCGGIPASCPRGHTRVAPPNRVRKASSRLRPSAFRLTRVRKLLAAFVSHGCCASQASRLHRHHFSFCVADLAFAELSQDEATSRPPRSAGIGFVEQSAG